MSLKPLAQCVCVLPQGELRISVLPTYLSYDAPWPVRKIPLRCTVHYVSYHVESKVKLLSAASYTNSTPDSFSWLLLCNTLQNKGSKTSFFWNDSHERLLALTFSYCNRRGKRRCYSLMWRLSVLLLSGVCRVHECEGTVHSHPQNDWRREGVWIHWKRSGQHIFVHSNILSALWEMDVC